jgi:hypothetical protein
VPDQTCRDKRDSSGNTGTDAGHDERRLATVVLVKTNRRRAAVGALGACVVLLSATACSSDSDSDSTAETLPDVTAEDTTGATVTPATQAPTTDASNDTAAPTDGADTSAEPAPTEPAVVVPEALQFTAPLVGGGTFDGAAAAGKPTVFWFWAPT